jgi:hypothetical protein
MQEATSKKSLRVLALCSALCVGGAFLPVVRAQSSNPGFKQDMRNTGHDTKQATKSASHHVQHGTKKAWHKTKHTTKKVTHKAAHKTDRGARKVERKTSPDH